MIPYRTNSTLNMTTIVWFLMKGSTSIWKPSSTTRCTGRKPIEELKNLQSFFRSNDKSYASSRIIPKKARKEVKKNSQGEARFCYLYKRTRIPYSNYQSHSDGSCYYAEYTEKKISRSIDDH